MSLLPDAEGELGDHLLVEVRRALAELERHAAENLARYKCPRIYKAVESLPKNPNGKLLRRHLREAYETARSEASDPRA